MATKTGSSYTTGTKQTASKFQRQVRDFRPWRARIMCRQVIATMADNRKWQCGHQNRKCISGSMTDRMTIPKANLRFMTTPSAKKLIPGDCENDRQPEMAIMAMWASKPEILIYPERWQIRWEFQRKLGVFDHAHHEETDPRRLRQRPTTGNGNIDILLANRAISGSRSLSQSFG